ncbi:hypothetical protein BDFB_002392, partial [Asbolus verrucosus]
MEASSKSIRKSSWEIHLFILWNQPYNLAKDLEMITPQLTANETMAFLKQFYDDHLISMAPRSPDLTAPDFFLFSCVKNSV